MIKQYQIGKSFVTIVGKTLEEIEAKKERYEKAKGILQEAIIKKESAPVKRKRRTKAEIEADELAAAQSESTAETEAEED